MLGLIKNLALDFILYFVSATMTKYVLHITSALGTTQNTLYIFEEVSKKMKSWKMIQATFNVNTHGNLLYALKVWDFIRKVRLLFLLKLLFIKIRCLINVNKIYGLLRNR